MGRTFCDNDPSVKLDRVRDKAFAGRVESSDYNWVIDRIQTDNNGGLRPAFDLDLTNVLFMSAAEGGKPSGQTLSALESYSGNEWKATFLDDTRSFTVTGTAFEAQQTKSLTVPYGNAVNADGEYISIIVFCNWSKELTCITNCIININCYFTHIIHLIFIGG